MEERLPDSSALPAEKRVLTIRIAYADGGQLNDGKLDDVYKVNGLSLSEAKTLASSLADTLDTLRGLVSSMRQR